MKRVERVSELGLQNEIHPLPLRLPPLPWEDLASFISRTSARMGYGHPNWILQPEVISYRIPTYTLDTLRKRRDYELLEHLLYIDEEALYNLTLHRFASRLQTSENTLANTKADISLPLMNLFTITRLKGHRTTKVCPLCLEEKPSYGRLYWNINSIVSCPKHHIFLIQECPECQYPIPLLRQSLVSCPQCKKGYYRHTALHRLPEDPYLVAGQGWIFNKLGIENKEHEGISEITISFLLQELSSQQYFQLLKAFQSLLYPLFPDHPFLRIPIDFPLSTRPLSSRSISLLQSEWVTFISTFHFIFDSWPSHFFELLDHLSRIRRKGFSEGGGVARGYGAFYIEWLYNRLKDSKFSFLREAFEDYIKGKHQGGSVDNRFYPFQNREINASQERDYVERGQAMNMLGVEKTALLALVNKGCLRAQKKVVGKDGNRYPMIFEKVDIEALLREWENLLPLSTVAHSYLGIGKRSVINLANIDLLVPVRSPYIDQYPIYLYKKEDVEYFVDEILRHAERKTKSVEEWIPFSSSLLSTQKVRSEILVEILKGNLRPIDTGEDVPLFKRLVLIRSELKQLRKRRQLLEQLSLREASTRLSVSYEVVLRWMSLGLLQGEHSISNRRSPVFLREEAVNTFRQTYTSSKEVSDQLGVELRTLIKCIRQGILHPVDEHKNYQKSNIFLFLREEAESQREAILQAESRRLHTSIVFTRPAMTLTVSEAAEQLCCTVSKVYHLVHAEQIPYVRLSSNIKSIYILSTDVERYKQNLVSYTLHTLRRDNRPSYSSDVTDIQWALLHPILSDHRAFNRHIYDIRELLNAALYIFQRNCAWRQLPDHFPPWGTVNKNFHQWCKTGTWDQVQRVLYDSAEYYKGMEYTQ